MIHYHRTIMFNNIHLKIIIKIIMNLNKEKPTFRQNITN